MKVCFVHLTYNRDNLSLDRDAYLEWVNLQQLPEEMARRGHDVHVVHLFPRDDTFAKGGVHYHFLSSGRLMRAVARLAGLMRRRPAPSMEPALRAASAIRRLRPDVIHFHGVVLTLNLFLLWLILGRRRPPIVVQYHGGGPAHNRFARRLQRFVFRRVDRFLFGTRWHAEPFVEAGVLRPDDARLAQVMEVSTAFRCQSREAARRQTGMRGNPVFLWAGRLHPVKDPLTALRGFERIHQQWPQAHLYLHYLTGELLPELRAYLDARPALAAHVHFRGRVPRPQMEAIYNSADFLLQASLREFSGFVLFEAMACGVIPVVTHIPAFRDLTAGGRFGILFPPGDDASLAHGVLSTDLTRIAARSADIRRHFENKLSFPAMATQLEQIYSDLVRRRIHSGP